MVTLRDSGVIVFLVRIYQIFTRGGLRGKANPASETGERQRPFVVKIELSRLRFQLQAAWIPGSGGRDLTGLHTALSSTSPALEVGGELLRARDLKEAWNWTP